MFHPPPPSLCTIMFSYLVNYYLSPRRTSSVTGWSHCDRSGVEKLVDLMEISIPPVPDSSCHREMITYGIAVDTTTEFCAGSEIWAGSFPGDAGGPLVVQRNNRYRQLGIVSYGIGCGTYGVYTKVPHYVDWIEGIINE